MTIWNNIYSDYQKGGEAWASLKESLLPRFVTFVQNNEFNEKSAFDIGVGTGKYLAYLKNLGFAIAGIDSSEVAVEMTKKVLDSDTNVLCVNMYEYEIPENRYDFIFSISTIYHGTKKEVISLLDQIYYKIMPGGKIFITLPDTASSKNWKTFKESKETSPGTYIPQTGPEKGLPHSFFSAQEISNIFSKFSKVEFELGDKGKWCIMGQK
ncbi:MAG: methyltransferase domain-containing protein [Patescibacteria group bacterium]